MINGCGYPCGCVFSYQILYILKFWDVGICLDALNAKSYNKTGHGVMYSYVMGIGEAEAFSERLKRELLALEAANVHAILESEPLVNEVNLLSL